MSQAQPNNQALVIRIKPYQYIHVLDQNTCEIPSLLVKYYAYSLVSPTMSSVSVVVHFFLGFANRTVGSSPLFPPFHALLSLGFCLQTL